MKNQKYCAYNLTTGEIIACRTGNQLKNCVRIAKENEKAFGICGEWIYGHKGIDNIMAKAKHISRKRARR